MLPKQNIDKMKLRHESEGVERRRNMSKLILDKAPNFPLAVELKDIDKCFRDWVENDLAISFDGKKLPTFKLFSNQRINEYAQTWNHVDETGNLLMNFKTITRDNNPKRGTSQGDYANIPGDRDYAMFMVPVLQENGIEAFDMYSMKQPFSVDLEYSVTLITNKYELLNEMNQLMNDKFKAIDCYIFPNQHPMPLTLEDITDESEYSLEDRKYYSQTYKLKLKAYIIKQEDYKVTKMQSRLKVRILGGDKTKRRPFVEVEEGEVEGNYYCQQDKDTKDRYYRQELTLNVNIPQCQKFIDFTMDTDMTVEEIEMSNVYDLAISINDEFLNIEDLAELYEGDKIHILISRDDEFQDSKIVMKGYHTFLILDTKADGEVVFDGNIDEKEINI